MSLTYVCVPSPPTHTRSCARMHFHTRTHMHRTHDEVEVPGVLCNNSFYCRTDPKCRIEVSCCPAVSMTGYIEVLLPMFTTLENEESHMRVCVCGACTSVHVEEAGGGHQVFVSAARSLPHLRQGLSLNQKHCFRQAG